MHVMFFGIKRVHLRILEVTRRVLAEMRLTPARFDMMRVIEAHKHGLLQRNVQELLGVSAKTVSRMLQALERLGFIVRKRVSRDSRRLRVWLTPLGSEIFGAARKRYVESGSAERFALRPFGLDPEVAHPKLKALRRILCEMRRKYGDYTPFEEPWRGGELPFPQKFVDEAA